MTRDWSQPSEVDDVLVAFPAFVVKDLMPPYEEIPSEFKDWNNPWVVWQQRWFMKGLPSFPKPKEGIDIFRAYRHLRCIQRSFEPKHEHKEAAVAYLASLWLLPEENS